jgi:hypothetical protein
VSDTEYTEFHYSGEIDSRDTQYNDANHPLFKKSTVTFPNSASATKYIIVTSDGNYALGANNKVVAFTADFERTDALYSAIWETTGSGTKWKNSSDATQYLNLYNSVTGSSGNNINVTTSSYDDVYAKFTMSYRYSSSRTYYLRFNNGTFSADRNNSSEFLIYQVIPSGTFWQADFVLQSVVDQVIAAKDANGTVLEFSTNSVSSNSSLPANSGEAPQAPARTEATNPTEVATVPPTTENGDNT